jgi:alkylation response protein AidB-like acyl-CoA dehydrogenase
MSLPGGAPDELFEQAQAWIEEHRSEAPRDYGAILPPELVDEGRAWQRALFDAGWAGIHWPTEVGGRGLTVEHTAAWTRACALAQVPPWINMVGLVLTGGAILAYGTPEQQATHLPRILDASDVWCQLFSEPGAGSDLASLTTRAELDGDTWVLTGQKVWCSNGRVADRGICLARTDPDAKPHAGISYFLVDMHLPGIDVRPLRQLTGGSEFDEVFLDEVRLPADALLGPLHGGWGVAMATLTNERGYIGSSSISLGRRLDQLASKIADGSYGPVEQDRLVSLLARGKALLWLGQRQGPVATVAGSLAKLGVTELMFDLAVLEGDLEGPGAMLRGEASARLLGAPGGRIAGGTTQVQKNIIGERILGLPKGS